MQVQDKIVGYGRMIGDAICFLYIQDIMVKPEYQGNKFVKRIDADLGYGMIYKG